MELVTAHYDLYSTTDFGNESAVLRVYSDGTSQMELHFNYLTYGSGYVYEMPDGAMIRLIRANNTDGYYGEGKVITEAENGGQVNHFSSIIPIDRALAESQYLKFALCKADGTQIKELRYKMTDFTSESGSWPAPESTPPVATIPPVSPTPTPTPRPTLVPGATEPPQDTALFTVNYKISESSKEYTAKSAKLRVYDEMSALTIQFTYDGELAEGTLLRMSFIDGQDGYYGEGPISAPDENGLRTAVILFNRQAGYMKRFNLQGFEPGKQQYTFRAHYTLSGSYPNDWDKQDALPTLRPTAAPTPTPLPEGSTPTPVPTEPPYTEAIRKNRYQLLDKVPHYGHYNATLRRYEDSPAVLTVYFRYSEDIPEGTILRLTQIDDLRANYGEAVIGTSTLDNSYDDLLCAKIPITGLPYTLHGFRLNAIAPDGTDVFEATFYGEDSPYADLVRELLNPTASASTTAPSSGGKANDYAINTNYPNSDYPTSTPYKSPLQQSIEEGMQIQPPSPGGFSW